MATLDTKTADPFAGIKDVPGDYRARFDAEDKVMEKLHKVSDSLPSPLTPDGKYVKRMPELAAAMVGRLIRWQIADGYAHYRITSAKPFKVQHLKFCDAYAVWPETLRGLRLIDAANMVVREQKFRELWNKR